ncbi:hypothetical protein JHL18_00505 [Clostridium sp. YIM B02505]|uniref:Uncharacterized protein n=1 Tax=Clostridium yunnanense TaxID=2800325 RepID=A0ABS1EID4_9CLOT|nr:hypothetical protein [Clostridium yunnanense]MBK1809129.1 hypothetical protein [Clostridium yunnanense]
MSGKNKKPSGGTQENTSIEGQLEWDENSNSELDANEDIRLDNEDGEMQNKIDILLYSIAGSFPKEEDLNSTLKKRFSTVILIILGVLTGVISIIIILQGFKIIQLEEWTLRLFVTGTFVEIVALINIMVTSLFPKDDRKVYLDFIKEFALLKDKEKTK